MSNPFERYYQVLGLEPGASWDEVNQAYKDLAFVWHPDRLPRDNPRLLEKAAARLKAINEAREHLRSHHEKITNSTRPAKSAPPTSAHPDPVPTITTRKRPIGAAVAPTITSAAATATTTQVAITPRTITAQRWSRLAAAPQTRTGSPRVSPAAPRP
ncbi:MAG: J domain-containing protein [Spirulinaceae cyanobacterium RM2_2_10]|nr:J domain-containing protein [Spirulinaceae cyanobacterium RM2_2_10]